MRVLVGPHFHYTWYCQIFISVGLKWYLVVFYYHFSGNYQNEISFIKVLVVFQALSSGNCSPVTLSFFFSWIVFSLICKCSLYTQDTQLYVLPMLLMSSSSLFSIAFRLKSKILGNCNYRHGQFGLHFTYGLVSTPLAPLICTRILAHRSHPPKFLFMVFPLLGIYLLVLCLASIDHSFTTQSFGNLCSHPSVPCASSQYLQTFLFRPGKNFRLLSSQK